MHHHRLLPLLVAATIAACGGDGGDSPAEGRLGEPPQGVWLKGDLHLHSHHSLDALDNPMAEIVAVAEERGMDYFVVTDHDNHVDGVIATWDDPEYRSDSMIMLHGVEFTTNKGHAVMLSAERWDHLRIWALRDGEGAKLGAEARQLGLHLSPAHPTNANPWLYGYDIGIDSMEVWNALFKFPTDDTETLNLWDRLLKAGTRLPGRGGSDCHHQQGIEPLGVNVGTPTTWVYARERDGQSVVDALGAGRASVSYAPGAERIEFWADTNGDDVDDAMMGDNIVPGGEPVDFRIEIQGFRPLAGYAVIVRKNGAEFQTFRPTGSTIRFTDTPPAGERTYYRVEVEGSTPEAETLPAQLVGFYGRMIGLTNPIYFGF